MKKVKKTGEYSIFQKRSGRYAVLDKEKKWVRGDDKTKLLVAEGLIRLPEPKTAAPVESEENGEVAPTEEAPDASTDAPAVETPQEAPVEPAT